ncbi:MAG: tetratricopeptide repeat-containing glycosyltransferase family protein, partial [Pseudomonadales bacterium]|nr:tetratricopeptide repeat-containing glycosyltransferase family protein [Pseudomonadales bacterium]
VIALHPGYVDAHLGRGNALNALGRHEEALAGYTRAIELGSENFLAHYSACGLLEKLGRYEDALASYDKLLALKPDCAEAYHDRGVILERLGRYDAALHSFDRTIALRPDYAETHRCRAIALEKSGRYAEALESCNRAIALKPDYAPAYYSRGVSLERLGRQHDALTSFDRAVTLDPHYAPAQFAKGAVLLRLGDYGAGWELYEWRLRGGVPLKHLDPRKLKQPQWRGEALGGQTILLYCEQGLGDSMQMLRYLPRIKAEAARVILDLPKTLQPLLGELASGITVVVERGVVLPRFDLQCSLMSLPLACGTRLDTIVAQVPYLSAPDERLPAWRARLPRRASLRVGLVWSGGIANPNDHNRSIALERLAPLLALEGVSFISLQKEYRDADLPALARLPIERIDADIADFGDTAAAIEQCDLVIAVDTAVVHLAGALGKPVWVLLPYVADWRWLLDRDDSPWYPTARLFRQHGIGDWEGVIAELVTRLRNLASGNDLTTHA